MAFYRGDDAVLSVAGTNMIEIKSWSVDTSAQPKEVPRLGDANVRQTAGKKTVGGTFVCWFDPADVAQNSLRTALNTDASVGVVLYPLGEGTGDPNYSGSIYVTGESQPVDYGECIEVTYTWVDATGNWNPLGVNP